MYCLLLDTIPAENISTVRIVITYLMKYLPEFFKNRIETRIIKNILKNERVCRDIYQKQKSTGTRWLWQQNEIPLPHNNPTQGSRQKFM